MIQSPFKNTFNVMLLAQQFFQTFNNLCSQGHMRGVEEKKILHHEICCGVPGRQDW